jgi:POT family proton-dependent oligopeptide transporter
MMNSVVGAMKRRIFFTLYTAEVCELFGRFAMTALLVLYFSTFFHLSDAASFSLFSAFYALLFVAPMVGGVCADRLLGQRTAAILGAGIMFLGNLFLTLPSLSMVTLGLSIVVVGYGLFVPNCTAMLSRLYDQLGIGAGDRDRGFMRYYIAKNIGALLGPVACGYVAHVFSMSAAFMLNALVLGVGFVALVLGRHALKAVSCAPTVRSQTRLLFALSLPLFVGVLYTLFRLHQQSYVMLLVALVAFYLLQKMFRYASSQQRRHFVLILVFMMLAFFFQSFLLQGSMSLSLFIERLVDRQLLGMTVPTPALFSLDPLFMILLGPVLALVVARCVRRQTQGAAFIQCGVGFVLLAAGFFVFVVAAMSVMHTGSASMLFVVLAYALFPLAELCVCPVTLSRVAQLAPQKDQSFVIGVYYLVSSGLASLLANVIAKRSSIHFELQTVAQKMHAAPVYKGLFMQIAGILLLFGLVIVSVVLLKRGFRATIAEVG